MYHIFSIHSSVDGHLGCFQVLTIVNSAAVNTEVHVSFGIMVFSGYMHRSGIKMKTSVLFHGIQQAPLFLYIMLVKHFNTVVPHHCL